MCTQKVASYYSTFIHATWIQYFWGEDVKDVKEFKPERWINEEGNLIKLPVAFMPFGAGNSHENP